MKLQKYDLSIKMLDSSMIQKLSVSVMLALYKCVSLALKNYIQESSNF